MKNGWRPLRKYEENTMGGQMILNKDFKEFIESLNDNRVHYLVVGGAGHGKASGSGWPGKFEVRIEDP